MNSRTRNDNTVTPSPLREALSGATVFDSEFWVKTLNRLGYPISEEEMNVATLKEQRAIPSDVLPVKVLSVHADDYVEVAVVEFPKGARITRSLCARTARSWKANRLVRPLLFFTNGKRSFAVVVPGRGTDGEARVLDIYDMLYRTDLDAIESMAYPGSKEELSGRYDDGFFPYEKVRDEFFRGYRDLYRRTEAAVRKHVGIASTSYAQKFLGRLMFLYFLQRKGWLNRNPRFIDGLRDYSELSTLFYESLNRGGTPGIPFLGGSLFEKEDYMDKETGRRLFAVMDPLFREARRFFGQYNFTVDELAPLEVAVSIDPALIGTVFEEMLPEYERGSRGTFYTPVREMSFICRRGIAGYLGLHDRVEGSNFIDGLDEYIETLRRDRNERGVREFRDRLLSIRVLDPAVGSGGFILIMMQELVGLIQEAEDTVGWKSDAQEYKKKILKNLYGFDIEPEATEIARLRLWLSLIIDEEEPEPLPNLDLNVLDIADSLTGLAIQRTIDQTAIELGARAKELKNKYFDEHDPVRKRKLKDEVRGLLDEYSRRVQVDSNIIEFWIPMAADIIVMNPPYVRHESIARKQRDYYVANYGLDTRSDLYAYFFLRALGCLSEDGVASVISSDKWLETGYGVSLQKKLKDHLIAIYGQRERSFEASINTVVTVYSVNKNRDSNVQFTYLEKYGFEKVRNHYSISKKELQPGKWFYLRAPKIFMEKILPKLTHRLRDFADIELGFKTGANDFFYMKDVSRLYGADYLANPKKFEEWGVSARNERELKERGLIYIKNEGGKRFVINRKDTRPLLRSPKQVSRFSIGQLTTLCLYTGQPGEFTEKYIEWGEHQKAPVKGKNITIAGYNGLEGTRNRKPWFKLPDLKPSRIVAPVSPMDTIFIPFSRETIITDNRLYALHAKNEDFLWIYLNSTFFLVVMELFSRRLGGGALEITVNDYDMMPVPDLNKIELKFDKNLLLSRSPKIYRDEVKEKSKIELDLAVAKAIGFNDAEEIVEQLHGEYIEVVDDRLIKAGRGLKREDVDDQDN